MHLHVCFFFCRDVTTLMHLISLHSQKYINKLFSLNCAQVLDKQQACINGVFSQMLNRPFPSKKPLKSTIGSSAVHCISPTFHSGLIFTSQEDPRVRSQTNTKPKVSIFTCFRKDIENISL